MSLTAKTNDGKTESSARAKRIIKGVLHFHFPATGLAKPFFRTLYRLHVAAREAWIWACRFFWYEPLFRSQCDVVGEHFQMEQLPYIVGRGRIVIGSNVRLSGRSSIAFSRHGIWGPPELRFGDGTFVGHQCAFAAMRSITIGKNCLIAGGVRIQDNDGHPLDATSRRAGDAPPPDSVSPVVIGDDVWIGSGALILKGVTIGDRCVIGARAVVTKSFPQDVVIAGNPARAVRELRA